MPPYDEQQVIAFVQSIEPISSDLGRLAVNTAEMQADATGYDGQPAMGYAASRAKHLAKLQAEFGVNPPEPVAAVRGPLPAFDTDAYDPDVKPPAAPILCRISTTLSAPIDPTPRLDYWRGDAWSVTLPGAPIIPRGSSRHPERMLSYLLHAYPADWQDRYLDAYVNGRQYSHLALSWPDARGMGVSVVDYVALSVRVKARVPYLAHFLTSKDWDPANATAATRMAGVGDVLTRLLAAGAIDIPIVGWELDAFNDPQMLSDFIDQVFLLTGLRLAVHFTALKTAWQINGTTRASFYLNHRGQIGWLLYQANQNHPAAVMQAHFNDAMVPASGLTAMGVNLVAFELLASLQFDGDVDEDAGNLRSYELLCTPGPMAISGFGGGCRYPDGRAI